MTKSSGLTAAAKFRQQAMFAALIQQQMVVDDTFGMRWAAWSLYQAAFAYQTSCDVMKFMNITRGGWNTKTLNSFMADHKRGELFEHLFPRQYSSMYDFVDMDNHECLDVMIKSVIILQAISLTPETFQNICLAFEVDPRKAWDKIVPDAELATAWFNQFKKPDLVAYAIDALDPDTVGIGKIAKDIKKSELVAALAKALTKGAPGQPDHVQERARRAMPIALASSNPTQEAAE